ncbi:MAG: branched-chain amino acid ABC transporter substrate-binding protein [Deltaproteobacteria bacterium]|jgi:branched-chain amino acid transport system substrate-binding protein|nr:branched-chain amino acid ABC transporter substrate-binding protein [Deltaproteobacteria bacterium]
MPKFFAVLAALCISVLSSGALEAQEETLKIGFGGALQGNLATYGRSNLFGIEYAVNLINAKGGLLGKQVELVKEDDSCDPSLATSAANKLKSAGLTLILGHTCSGATRSALSVYANSAIVISSSATENSLTFDGLNPYFFRTTPYDSTQSKLQTDLILRLGSKKVAILHDKSDYGKSLADFTAAYIRELPGKPVEIVLEEGVTTNQVSYDSVISAVKNSEADTLVWGGYYSDGSKIAISLREKGVTARLIGADGLRDNQFILLAGPAAEGVFATGQMDFSASEEARAAIADHRSRHKDEMGTYFFYAIAAAQSLFAAVEKTGNATDLNAIKKHLNEDTVDTIMGPVRYDQNGDIIGAFFKVYRVQNGEYVEYGETAAPALPEAAAAPAP